MKVRVAIAPPCRGALTSVIFGTDFPVLDFKRTRDEFEALGLRPEVRARVLRDNVIDLYDLPVNVGLKR